MPNRVSKLGKGLRKIQKKDEESFVKSNTGPPQAVEKSDSARKEEDVGPEMGSSSNVGAEIDFSMETTNDNGSHAKARRGYTTKPFHADAETEIMVNATPATSSNSPCLGGVSLQLRERTSNCNDLQSKASAQDKTRKPGASLESPIEGPTVPKRSLVNTSSVLHLQPSENVIDVSSEHDLIVSPQRLSTSTDPNNSHSAPRGSASDVEGEEWLLNSPQFFEVVEGKENSIVFFESASGPNASSSFISEMAEPSLSFHDEASDVVSKRRSPDKEALVGPGVARKRSMSSEKLSLSNLVEEALHNADASHEVSLTADKQHKRLAASLKSNGAASTAKRSESLQMPSRQVRSADAKRRSIAFGTPEKEKPLLKKRGCSASSNRKSCNDIHGDNSDKALLSVRDDVRAIISHCQAAAQVSSRRMRRPSLSAVPDQPRGAHRQVDDTLDMRCALKAKNEASSVQPSSLSPTLHRRHRVSSNEGRQLSVGRPQLPSHKRKSHKGTHFSWTPMSSEHLSCSSSQREHCQQRHNHNPSHHHHHDPNHISPSSSEGGGSESQRVLLERDPLIRFLRHRLQKPSLHEEDGHMRSSTYRHRSFSHCRAASDSTLTPLDSLDVPGKSYGLACGSSSTHAAPLSPVQASYLARGIDLETPTRYHSPSGRTRLRDCHPSPRGEHFLDSSPRSPAQMEKAILAEVEQKLELLAEQIVYKDNTVERAMLSSPWERLYHLNNRRDREERRQLLLNFDKLERIREKIVTGAIDREAEASERRRSEREAMLQDPNNVYMRLYNRSLAKESENYGCRSSNHSRSSTPLGKHNGTSRSNSHRRTSRCNATDSCSVSKSGKFEDRCRSPLLRTQAQQDTFYDQLYHYSMQQVSRKEERARAEREAKKEREFEEFLVSRMAARLERRAPEKHLQPEDELVREARRKWEETTTKGAAALKACTSDLLHGPRRTEAELKQILNRLRNPGYDSPSTLEKKRLEQELRGCTFHPKINAYQPRSARRGQSSSVTASRKDDRAVDNVPNAVPDKDREMSLPEESGRTADSCHRLYKAALKSKCRERKMHKEYERAARLEILKSRMSNDHHFRRRVELDPSLAERFMKSLVV